MSRVVIKRKLSLDFLGKEYKESYLIFKAIPFREYEELKKKTEELDDETSLKFITDLLGQHFISGKFPGEDNELFDLKSEDLVDFDGGTLIKMFQTLTGEITDPKE